MILGMSVENFTLLHVIISLIGIFSGLVMLAEILLKKRLGIWNSVFLLTTIATSVTGFFFHSSSFGPPHIVGVISLVILAVAVAALYGKHLAGRWRAVYAVTAVIALYLNVFVGVVQSFQKLPFLNVLAPTQTEPPFIATQVAVLIVFVILDFLAAKRLKLA
jgi:hypothetical protein